jgi:hypothetical protein
VIVLADLMASQWQQVKIDRASAEEIAGSVTEFSRARTAEYESSGRVFQKPVNFLEQSGHMLDLVDDDKRGPLRQDLLAKSLWAYAQLGAQRCVQEVIEPRFGVAIVEKSRLSRLPRPP